jgi:hypothetical protein
MIAIREIAGMMADGAFPKEAIPSDDGGEGGLVRKCATRSLKRRR